MNVRTYALAFALTAIGTEVAHAQEPTEPARPEREAAASTEAAAAQFARGYQLAQAGDLDAAIVAFELAYRTQPNFSVLYNLAQAYAASGRVVEAVDTFERYLESGAERVPEARRIQVREAVRMHLLRIGSLALRDVPAGFEVRVDGGVRGVTPLTGPLRLSTGEHSLVVSKEGYTPYVSSLRVTAGTELVVHPVLERQLDSALVLSCDVPDVSVAVDNEVVAFESPLRLPANAGSHVVSFTRRGYHEHRIEVPLEADEERRVACVLTRDPAHPGTSRLALLRPEGTDAYVDGKPYLGPHAIPAGRHQIEVVGAGYETLHRTVILTPNQAETVNAVPSRSAQSLEAERERLNHGMRTVSYIAAATSLVSGATAIGIYYYNEDEAREWQDKSTQLSQRFANAPEEVSSKDIDQLIQEENQIRDRDSVALGLAVLAGASLVVAGVLFGFSLEDDPVLVSSGNTFDVRLRF